MGLYPSLLSHLYDINVLYTLEVEWREIVQLSLLHLYSSIVQELHVLYITLTLLTHSLTTIPNQPIYGFNIHYN